MNDPARPNLKRMPVLFVGHGTPMNAIEDNQWSKGFTKLASLIPIPKAILSISAHWFIDETLLTSNQQPRTIHDFGGFPDELYEIQYPALGDEELAGHVVEILGNKDASLSSKWGIDHGTWSVLRRMYPGAEHPVVQLSIDYSLKPKEHFEIGRKLSILRDQGYLIIGSGNITHNLDYAISHVYRGDNSTPSWATDFDIYIKNALLEKQYDALLTALSNNIGQIAHPTHEHFLPLLYATGCSDPNDSVQFPITGFDMGSLSMRAVIFGNTS
jgi:4,5-DOPA dioxygenase extradiol